AHARAATAVSRARPRGCAADRSRDAPRGDACDHHEGEDLPRRPVHPLPRSSHAAAHPARPGALDSRRDLDRRARLSAHREESVHPEPRLRLQGRLRDYARAEAGAGQARLSVEFASETSSRDRVDAALRAATDALLAEMTPEGF